MSTKWSLNSADFHKILHNALVFLSPVALIYLAFVAGNLSNGVSLSAFIPTPIVQGAMVLYVVNVLIDFFRKLSAGELSQPIA